MVLVKRVSHIRALLEHYVRLLDHAPASLVVCRVARLAVPHVCVELCVGDQCGARTGAGKHLHVVVQGLVHNAAVRFGVAAKWARVFFGRRPDPARLTHQVTTRHTDRDGVGVGADRAGRITRHGN